MSISYIKMVVLIQMHKKVLFEDTRATYKLIFTSLGLPRNRELGLDELKFCGD